MLSCLGTTYDRSKWACIIVTVYTILFNWYQVINPRGWLPICDIHRNAYYICIRYNRSLSTRGCTFTCKRPAHTVRSNRQLAIRSCIRPRHMPYPPLLILLCSLGMETFPPMARRANVLAGPQYILSWGTAYPLPYEAKDAGAVGNTVWRMFYHEYTRRHSEVVQCICLRIRKKYQIKVFACM